MTPTSSTKSPTQFLDLLRHVRLQFVASTLAHFSGGRWNADTERRKVAIYQNRTIAAMHSLPQAVPLAGAIVLLMLQWTNYWVGHNDNSTTLQFVAKVHELAIQASIIDVILCVVRTGLINDIVPLGALSGAMQATQLSYLWSLDFLSIIRTQALLPWRRFFFAIAIPGLILLISLVGPSTAILMIPRPKSTRILPEGTTILYSDKSKEMLYPSQISLGEEGNFDLSKFNTSLRHMYPHEDPTVIPRKIRDPWGKLEEVAQVYPDYGKGIHDRIVRHSEYEWIPTTADSLIDEVDHMGTTSVTFGNSKFNATMPPAFASILLTFVSNQASSWSFTNDITTSVWASQPFVGVQSWSSCIDYSLPSDNLYYWKDDRSSLEILSKPNTFTNQVSDQIEYRVREMSIAEIWFAPIWLPSPEPGSRSLIGIFLNGYVNMSSASLNTTGSELSSLMLERKSLFFVVCTVSASWVTAEVQLTLDQGRTILKNKRSLLWLMDDSRSRPIALGLNGSDTLQSAKFHRYLAEGAERPAYTLAVAITTMLSKFPGAGDVDPRPSIYPSPATTSSGETAFKCVSIEQGYGYSHRSTPVYLAMTVLCTYCIIVIAYIAYMLITGSASTAWNSGIELFTLALQSEQPDHLGYTSVGIDSIKTFSEGVGVRVNTDNKLEIVFEHDRDFKTRGLRKVVRNVEY